MSAGDGESWSLFESELTELRVPDALIAALRGTRPFKAFSVCFTNYARQTSTLISELYATLAAMQTRCDEMATETSTGKLAGERDDLKQQLADLRKTLVAVCNDRDKTKAQLNEAELKIKHQAFEIEELKAEQAGESQVNYKLVETITKLTEELDKAGKELTNLRAAAPDRNYKKLYDDEKNRFFQFQKEAKAYQEFLKAKKKEAIVECERLKKQVAAMASSDSPPSSGSSPSPAPVTPGESPVNRKRRLSNDFPATTPIVMEGTSDPKEVVVKCLFEEIAELKMRREKWRKSKVATFVHLGSVEQRIKTRRSTLALSTDQQQQENTSIPSTEERHFLDDLTRMVSQAKTTLQDSEQ